MADLRGKIPLDVDNFHSKFNQSNANARARVRRHGGNIPGVRTHHGRTEIFDPALHVSTGNYQKIRDSGGKVIDPYDYQMVKNQAQLASSYV